MTPVLPEVVWILKVPLGLHSSLSLPFLLGQQSPSLARGVSINCREMSSPSPWISAYTCASAQSYCPMFHKLKALPY